jgi:isopenicillin-N N-acyltransferase like protein
MTGMAGQGAAGFPIRQAPGEVEMFIDITASGPPIARGKLYGSSAKSRIETSIATYARLFAYRRGLDWTAVQEAARAYLPVLEAGAPDVLEEIRGIAQGSGRRLEEILALNVRTELLAGKDSGHVHPGWQEALFANSAAGVPAHPDDGGELVLGDTAADGFASADAFGECTTVAAQPAATASGKAFLAQTWDWDGEQRKALVLLRLYASNEPEILTLTEAGMVAKHGLNSAGLAVGLNAMRGQNDGQRVGMPVHVLLRMMLAARTFDEAKAIPKAHQAAASSCIVLASAQGDLAALEICPDAVAEVQAQNGLLAHSNHALDAGVAANECEIGPGNSTRQRYQRASELMKTGRGDRGKLHFDDVKAILRDHAGPSFRTPLGAFHPACICRHPDKSVAAVDRRESVCALIIDLGDMAIHVAPGLPCTSEFQTIKLDDIPVPTRSVVPAVLEQGCTFCLPM